jgi:hypothetical protein
MNNRYKFPVEFRRVIARALPEDTSLHGRPPELRYMYLPAAHGKALRPDSMLVVGIRGSGKSFWWAALQQETHRAVIGRRIDFGGPMLVSTGFGERPSPDDYPSKDVIRSLAARLETRKIWLTVVLHHVARGHLPEEFTSASSWEARTEWVEGNPEAVESALYRADGELDRAGKFHLVLFDALDRTADEWSRMNALTRGLLQVLLEFRSYRRIRLKVFVRPDQIEDPGVTTFPDASKVLAQKTELLWPSNELYGLFWQYLANEDQGGEQFRAGCQKAISVSWREQDGVWMVPEELRSDSNAQRIVFHAMTGEWMGRDRRRGFPYTWLPNHLGDARRQVSPRSFLAALRYAALDDPRPDQEYALHYESIKKGVQEASKIRVQEIEEDYPWVRRLLGSLTGISVPCSFDEIKEIWVQSRVLEELKDLIGAAAVRLPPSRIEKGPDGVLEDLIALGIVERIGDGRINLPDVYRVGYGIGRRGGVKPVFRQPQS